MEDYTTEEIYQITQGLIHQYDINRAEMRKSTNPDLCLHYKKAMDTAEKAYLKLIKVYNRRKCTELMQELAAKES